MPLKAEFQDSGHVQFTLSASASATVTVPCLLLHPLLHRGLQPSETIPPNKLLHQLPWPQRFTSAAEKQLIKTFNLRVETWKPQEENIQEMFRDKDRDEKIPKNSSRSRNHSKNLQIGLRETDNFLHSKESITKVSTLEREEDNLCQLYIRHKINT